MSAPAAASPLAGKGGTRSNPKLKMSAVIASTKTSVRREGLRSQSPRTRFRNSVARTSTVGIKARLELEPDLTLKGVRNSSRFSMDALFSGCVPIKTVL